MSRPVYFDSEGNDITQDYMDELDRIVDDINNSEKPVIKPIKKKAKTNVSEDFDPKMSCRETVLENAKHCICTDRQNQYGPPEDSFAFIAQLWTIYLAFNNQYQERGQIMASDVANMMILLKIARTNGYKGHTDNYIDICGYGALAAELAEEVWSRER